MYGLSVRAKAFALVAGLFASFFWALPAHAASGVITAEFVVGYKTDTYYSSGNDSITDLELPRCRCAATVRLFGSGFYHARLTI